MDIDGNGGTQQSITAIVHIGGIADNISRRGEEEEVGRGWGDAEGRDGFRILRGRSRSGNRRTECEITATHPRKATYLHARLDVRQKGVLAHAGDQP